MINAVKCQKKVIYMLTGYLVPHPPLIVAGVGDGTEIPDTRASYTRIGAEIAALSPDVLVVISPHSVMYADYFHISPGNSAVGSFARFGCPQIKYEVTYDNELAARIAEEAGKAGIPAGFAGETDRELDWGVTVPLNFISHRDIVRVGLSGLPFLTQYRFGMCIRRAIEALGRRAVIIASGDMSHKLGGSYGFSEYGAEHDKYIRDSIARSVIARIMNIDPSLSEKAAECGLRSIMIMCGAFDGLNTHSEVLSYECPYGVGYLTARFTADGKAESLLSRLTAGVSSGDAYVRLAKANIEHFVRTGKVMPPPENLPEKMLKQRAGVFVSIKKNGELRGCIGTIAPTCASVAEEILQNGVSACSRDPRFNPVTPGELEALTYSVDILNEPEPVPDKSFLDVTRYGVIVTSGYKRGLLLPNLDGVDTVEQQVSIAMQKGGISPREPYKLERFEVVRHT